MCKWSLFFRQKTDRYLKKARISVEETFYVILLLGKRYNWFQIVCILVGNGNINQKLNILVFQGREFNLQLKKYWFLRKQYKFETSATCGLQFIHLSVETWITYDSKIDSTFSPHGKPVAVFRAGFCTTNYVLFLHDVHEVNYDILIKHRLGSWEPISAEDLFRALVSCCGRSKYLIFSWLTIGWIICESRQKQLEIAEE